MNEDLIQSCYENLEKRSKTIRLLHLMPALHPEDSRIQCRLVTASLDTNPTYEALSYTWGECDDLNLCVWINGVLFPVRKNLWEALHGLKSGLEVERVLWIDALCINQLSIGERNHQVGLMGEIYHGAQAVLVWLGGGHSYTTTAGASESFHSTFAFLKKAAEEARSIDFHREEGLSEDVRKWSDCFVGNKEFRGHWQQLEYLLSTQYWKRLWIFQEITLARKIRLIWGNSTCNWEDFDAIGRAMNHYPNITSVSGMTKFNFPLTAKTHQFMSMISVLRSRARRFSIIRDEILFSRQKLPIDWEWGEETFPLIRRPHPLILGDLLSACEGSYCQDPRDRIYGILGLLRYKTEASITVDYDRTIAELYEVVMEYFFQQGQPRNSIVRFSHHLQRAMLGPLSQSSPPLIMDLGKCSAECSKPTILLEGNITGYVAKLDSDTARLFKNFEHVEASFLSLGKNYSNCRILRRLRRLDPKCIARNLGPEMGADPVSQNRKEIDDGELIMFSMIEHFEKSPLVSRSRQIGIAAANIKISDLICQFDQTDVAAILRPHANGYTVISRAVITDRRGKHQNMELKWPPPAFSMFMSIPPRNNVEVEICLRHLQYLSCPLVQRTYQEMVRDYGDGPYGDISVMIPSAGNCGRG